MCVCVCKHDHKTHTHTALPGSHDVYQDIPTRDSAVMKESPAYGSNSLPQLGRTLRMFQESWRMMIEESDFILALRAVERHPDPEGCWTCCWHPGELPGSGFRVGVYRP